MVLADEMQFSNRRKEEVDIWMQKKKGCNFFQPAKECNEEKPMQLWIAFNS